MNYKRSLNDELVFEIICFFSDSFHKQVIEIDLVLACLGELNTVVRNGVHWPILYGAGNVYLCFIR